MSEFTPGPWTAIESPRAQTYMGNTVIVNNEKQWVAVTHTFGMQNCAEANAALIASAPDLLAALIAMLHTEWAKMPGDLGEFEIRSDVLEQAREAIRKATGGC